MDVTSSTNTIRILKIETCSALLEGSTLAYQIACNVESGILLRVVNNTEGGIFNKEWIALDSILEAFYKHPSDKPIESSLLAPLFQGTLTNSPGFLLAVLKKEGLVSRLEGKPHYYARMNPDEFMVDINKLIQSGVNLDVDEI